MIGCYILYSELYNRFYIGATHEDPTTRLQKHNNKFYGGTSTSYTNDWELFLFIACSSYPQAINVERHIKKMKSTSYIFNLVKYPEMIEKLLKNIDEHLTLPIVPITIGRTGGSWFEPKWAHIIIKHL